MFESFTELYEMPENIKLSVYRTEKQIYLLNAILFEKLYGSEQRSHTYVDVYR